MVISLGGMKGYGGEIAFHCADAGDSWIPNARA